MRHNRYELNRFEQSTVFLKWQSSRESGKLSKLLECDQTSGCNSNVSIDGKWWPGTRLLGCHLPPLPHVGVSAKRDTLCNPR